MTSPRYILALLPLSHHYAREVAGGLRRYERDRARWGVRIGDASVEHLEHALANAAPNEIGGIVAFASSLELVAALRATGLPVVNVSGRLPTHHLPTVVTDNFRLGQLAAQHLLDRGFRQFGYLGKPENHFSEVRLAGFADRLKTEGFEPTVYTADQIPALLDWSKVNPEPSGVMTCYDALARELVDDALDHGLQIPEDLAVIGADDNEFNCQQGRVLISSVPTEGRRVGFFAASLLDRLMAGDPPPKHPQLVAPVVVITRESTDVVAIADPILAVTLHYIHQHACDPINVTQLSERTGIARRTMEKHFRQYLGRTPREEIRRVQINRARRLLAETEQKIAEVARRSGFGRTNYFVSEFKRATGQPPAAYRKQIQLGPNVPTR